MHFIQLLLYICASRSDTFSGNIEITHTQFRAHNYVYVPLKKECGTFGIIRAGYMFSMVNET